MRIATMIVVALVTGLSWGGRAALAQTVTCTPITALPYTISTGGAYCLTGNLSYSNGSAAAPPITINFSGVVLDFNGYRLMYSGAGTSSNSGVKVLADNPNVVIRNGLISTFRTAVTTYSLGTIVEDMRLYASPYAVEIMSGADGAVIRRNYFRNAGQALVVLGNSTRIVDNDIYGADSSSDDGVMIWADNVFVMGNRLGRLDQGIDYTPGFSGKYRDNITANVTTPYTGGTDAGNND